MSFVGPTDGGAPPMALRDERVIELPSSRSVGPACPHTRDSQLPCWSCRAMIRMEALAWLRELADDHFGLSLDDPLATAIEPDVRILHRDHSGVVRLVGPESPPQ